METENNSEGLKRVIGVPALAATVVNNMVGGGVYVLPAVVCMAMGDAGVLAYLFCGAMMVTIMLCYMEIGTAITASGGSYIYVERAFGKFPGFIVNWLIFFGFGVLSSAALMNVLADSLAVMVPAFTNPLMRALLYLVLLGAMAWINVRGAKESVKAVQAITVIKLLPLLGIVVLGASHIKAINLRWENFPPLATFGSTGLIVFYMFAGFETSLGNSGEIRDPVRTLPRGLFLGAAVVFVFYVLIHMVLLGVLGPEIGKYKSAPLAAVAGEIVGPVGATILLIAAIISVFGNVGGDVLGTPRLLFSGANDGLFPKFLSKVHPKFATPYLAVITYSALILCFAVSGGFRQLAVLASGALLLVYLGVVLSMIKLRYTKGHAAPGSFKAPGGLVTPIIAIIAIVWLLTHLTALQQKATGIFIIAICIIYFIMKWFKTRESATKDH